MAFIIETRTFLRASVAVLIGFPFGVCRFLREYAKSVLPGKNTRSPSAHGPRMPAQASSRDCDIGWIVAIQPNAALTMDLPAYLGAASKLTARAAGALQGALAK